MIYRWCGYSHRGSRSSTHLRRALADGSEIVSAAQPVEDTAEPGAYAGAESWRLRLPVGARIGQMLEFEPAVAADRQLYGGAHHLGIVLEATMPAANEALLIGFEVEPSAQIAYFKFSLTKCGYASLWPRLFRHRRPPVQFPLT